MDNRIIIVFVGVVALVFSLMFGNMVAAGDYGTMAMISVAGFGILYFVKLYQFAGLFVIALALSGVIYHSPVGAIPSNYMALGLFSITACYEMFKPAKGVVEARQFKSAGIFCMCAIALFCCMFLYQVAVPVSAYDFNTKQTFKALLELMAPFLILAFWFMKSDAHVFRWGSMRPILMVLYFLLILHIAFRCYLIFRGLVTFGEDRLASDESEAAFALPAGFAVSPYVLRGLGPTAVVLAAFITLSPLSKGDKGDISLPVLMMMGMPPWFRFTRGLAWSLIFLGLIGALLSSGRGAPLLCVLGFIVAAVYYRHYLTVISAGVTTLLAIAALNMFPDLVEKLPAAISRSVAIVVIEDSSNVSKSISSSTSWREELADLAYDEWTDSADVFIRGRGVYTYSHLDGYAQEIQGGYEAKMISSLRTGNVHVSYLGIALRFGLIALIAWYALHLYLCIVGSKISLKRRRSGIQPLFVAYIYLMCLWFLISLISSGGMSIAGVLGLLMATRHMEKNQGQLDQDEVKENISQ